MLRGDITHKLQEYAETECFKLFIQYFKSEIASLRERNDTAESSELIHNQGAIKQLKIMLELQNIKLRKAITHDGAFN